MKKSLTTLGAMALGATSAMADTDANKQIVIDGMTNAFMRGNVEAVDTYFADPYTQHNPLAASGVEALKGLLTQMPGNPVLGPDFLKPKLGVAMKLMAQRTQAFCQCCHGKTSPSTCCFTCEKQVYCK